MAPGTLPRWPSDGFTIEDLLDDEFCMEDPPWQDDIEGDGWSLTCASLLSPSKDDYDVVEVFMPGSSISCGGKGAPWSDTKAVRAICKFCQGSAAGCLVPKVAELDSLWRTAVAAGASAIATALRSQLAPPSGGALGGFWAPRLRALHALEHFCRQGGKGVEVFHLVLAKASSQLDRLAVQVPQCSKQAKRVLAMKELCDTKSLSL